jgi:hypothetical protein
MARADPASGRLIGKVSATVRGMIIGAGVVLVMVSSALGANPAEEMAKVATNSGADPKGNSWQSIQNSVQQFGHPEFILRLLISFGLAVGCAWVIAWHPRRSSVIDPIVEFEKRKALIILGMVGAVIAELSGSNQTLAFVIFGIGALLRFRTALDDPKLTGKAIIVVVVGLACGMGSWAMAIFVTAFSWLLIFWLDSRATCQLRIRFNGRADPGPIVSAVESLLALHRCRLQSSTLYEDKGRMAFIVSIPAGIDPKRLETEVRTKLRKSNVTKIDVHT